MKKLFPFIILFFSILGNKTSFAQLSIDWSYFYNVPNNYEASANSVVCIPSGTTVTGGNYRSETGFSRKNTLVIVDSSGNLIASDTSTLGFGYTKLIYDGQSHVYALGSLQNDSTQAKNLLVTKIDTSNWSLNNFVPDSSELIYYDPLDLTILSDENLIIGSRMENWPILRLSLIYMSPAGNLIRNIVDSTFEIKYDLKIIADQAGGFFVSGSGRDTLTSNDFIFISHFDSTGARSWHWRYYSPQLFFADFLDMIQDHGGNIWLSGSVMETAGQRGILFKLDENGNVLSSRDQIQQPYERILCDLADNIYAFNAPMNGINATLIYKMDSTGVITDSSSFNTSGYFTSILNDVKLLSNNTIAMAGELFVLSFPKSDLYLSIIDSTLNVISYDIFDSLNLLGESARNIARLDNENLFVCGRFNYENQFETCNIGLIKYSFNDLFNENPELQENSFIVYPNPTSDRLSIKMRAKNPTECIIKIYSFTGSLVFSRKFFPNISTIELPLNLECGNYILEITTQGKIEKQKFCIIQ